jgi:hypothetical protein
MTKMTKNILMVGGVAIVGYLLYKKYGNQAPKPAPKGTGTSNFTADETFFSANGTRRTRMGGVRSCSAGSNDPACNLCGQSCENGKCYYAIYDKDGNIGSYRQTSCSGEIVGGVMQRRK